jgi:hypothetical protein
LQPGELQKTHAPNRNVMAFREYRRAITTRLPSMRRMRRGVPGADFYPTKEPSIPNKPGPLVRGNKEAG